MNFKSDITKSKIVSNVESDGTALYYKSAKLNKINDNFTRFFKKILNLVQPLTILSQSNF